MHFQHSTDIWRDFPELVAGVLVVGQISTQAHVATQVTELSAAAGHRLATASEGDFPEVQAWRRAFSRMGLKPTQYRCASESLLRRYRKQGSLPGLHPLVDLCNAASMGSAIPVAAFDLHRINGNLEVRRAGGDESYLAFSGQTEHPDVGEVIFADDDRQVHARRWTNRQSGASAVGDATTTALIVTEAMHDTAAIDVRALQADLVNALEASGARTLATAILSQPTPRFTIEPTPAPTG